MLALTFLPGTLLSAESFDALRHALGLVARHARTLLLGDTPTLAQELHRLAAVSAVPQIWIGHSLGGIAAIQLALAHPASCVAIVCMNSTSRADLPGNRAHRQAQLARATAADSCQPVCLELKPVLGLVPGSPLARSLARQADEVGLARFARQTQYAIERPDARAFTRSLPCPVLAISGGDDDICTPEMSDEIAALPAKHARPALHIARAGHLLPMTHAEQAAAHILTFLAELTHKT
jgi:pimeloyl-ACP methyl ester carboxylesterase